MLLTPGIYTLSSPIAITKPNTVVLGLGLATLTPVSGTPAMTVADVDGVRIGGILFDAGPANSPVLLQIGPPGSGMPHAADPIALYDIYCRIGGAGVGNAQVSVQINSADVIGDNFWLWRADHGTGIGWTINTAANGLVVNGANAILYGLAVEHYQQYQTLWNANGGQLYFYQSEEPYDVPNQAAWMNGSSNGYASYKVADSVRTHQAWGLGIYCFFQTNPSVKLENAVEVPISGLNGAMMHNLTTVSLGGIGEITHILDGEGAAANTMTQRQTLRQ